MTIHSHMRSAWTSRTSPPGQTTVSCSSNEHWTVTVRNELQTPVCLFNCFMYIRISPLTVAANSPAMSHDVVCDLASWLQGPHLCLLWNS